MEKNDKIRWSLCTPWRQKESRMVIS